VTIDFIYFGKGDMSNTTETMRGVFSTMVRRIPLVQLENMTEIQGIVSGLEPMLAAAIPVSHHTALPERAIFIEIQDRSMSNPNEPVSFEPGDKAMIDLNASPAPADFVLVLVPEEGAALFRLYREVGRGEDGSMIADLVPLNPNFRTIRISGAGSAQIIGVCCEVHRILSLAQSPHRGRSG
jgi:SOS-response transcriptional repressor LexA